MKNLNKLGLIFSVGGMSALLFALNGCSSEDPPPPVGGAGTSAGGSAGNGTSGSGGDSAGTSNGGSASGSGGDSAGSGGSAEGGTGAVGGTGGDAGSGGTGGDAGGSGGSGGSGGGAPSEACSKLCEGADSIVTICAEVAAVPASLKATPSCLERCAEATPANITCWQTHAINYREMQGPHCLHAAGDGTVCMAWPPE